MKQHVNVTQGQVLGETRLAGFHLTESRHSGGIDLEKHSHARAGICFVLDGSFIEDVGPRPLQVERDQLLIKPAGCEHSDRFPQPMHSLLVEVEPERQRSLETASRIFDSPALLDRPALSAIARRLYSEFKAAEASADLAIEGLLLLLIAESSREEKPRRGPKPLWLQQVIERIDDSFKERLELNSLAAEAGVHPVHLAKCFQQHTGQSVGSYQRQRRIEWSARRLSETRDPIAQIAISAGFADQSHFTRHFKRLAGFTPAQYRRLHEVT
ncbi:MAG: helix-turn-helix transcriptional regulator [Planctomycetota bacterium]|jgi:AraC family transcriptional regulator